MALRAHQPAVQVRDVHKWYRVYASPTERIKRVLGRRSRHLDIQALDRVSFDLPAGTALGIIGENGSGKSTFVEALAWAGEDKADKRQDKQAGKMES